MNENMYTPPFTVSAKAIKLIAEISAQIELYSIRMGADDSLRLRKANRIKTIHSSLAIEGNSLTSDEVSDIINGKNIVAPVKQIQEVRNAIKAYELFPSLDPYSINDLLKAHAVMMESLADDAGMFRKRGVGVYSGTNAVHIAPQAHMVSGLMNDLFNWLNKAEDHLLIKSCVFHYEFEFIHPFSDGNGRTGRLWQSLILSKLHPLFENLPVENMVYANQAEYYEAISKSSDIADSGPFIEFMLKEILAALKAHQGNPVASIISEKEQLILDCIMANPETTAKALSDKLGISARQIERLISTLKEKGILVHSGSRKAGRWISIHKI